MTNKRLSLGLLMTILLVGAVAPALTQDAFAASLTPDLSPSGDIEIVGGATNNVVTLYFDDPSDASGLNVTPDSGSYSFTLTGSTTGTLGTSTSDPSCDGTTCNIDVTTATSDGVAGETVTTAITFTTGTGTDEIDVRLRL